MLTGNSAAILTDAFPAKQRGMALGVNMVAAVAGSFLGLLIGGLLSEWHWQAVFWVGVPIGIVGTIWSYRSLRELGSRTPGRLDWAGAVTFEAGAILADGEPPSRPPITQARASAHALALLLREKLEQAPACMPVVCFASNTFKPELLTCDDTVICNATALQTLIVTCACHLSSDEIERIVKVMEQKDS